MMRTETVYET